MGGIIFRHANRSNNNNRPTKVPTNAVKSIGGVPDICVAAGDWHVDSVAQR